ncbi:MAG: S8 family serine peptidase [Candidatus Methylomirabilales bacterium]
MQGRRGTTAAVLLAVAVLGLGSDAAAAQGSPRYVPGEILVKWAPDVSEPEAGAARAAVAGLTRRMLHRLRWEHLEIDPTLDVPAAVQRVLQQPGVLWAQPNYLRRVTDTTPNDPSYASQWSLPRIGAPQAWDLRTGAAGVIVAVVDTGLAAGHPDLAPNLWVNPREIAGNGVDDDGNGKVDDVSGWNFVAQSNDPADDDPDRHGTHVASIIGARGNDGAGMSGIAWSVKLLPLKTCNQDGWCRSSNIAAAVEYATQVGAHVLNASFSGPDYSQVERDAFAAFPGLVVAAAGNGTTGTDLNATPVYPACFAAANIVGVAASDRDDGLAYFSNFGTSCVELAAPGTGIPGDGAPDAAADLMSGTSAAAPHVAGVAALLAAQEPNRTTAELRAALLEGVEVRAGLSGKVATGGRLNAYQALLGVRPLDPTSLAGIAADGRRVVLSWQDNAAGETRHEVQRRRAADAFVAVTETLAADSESYTDAAVSERTAYTYRVRAWNSGAASAFSNEVTLTTPLAGPTGFTAMRASATAAALQWADNSGAETGYEIQRRTGAGDFAPLASLAANATSYTDTGLDAAATYTYRVRAVGPDGDSAFSADATAVAQTAGESTGGGGGGCFIATAAYGSPLAAEVQRLRDIRDRYLLGHAPGRWLVAAYERLSPPLAAWIRDRDAARAGAGGAPARGLVGRPHAGCAGRRGARGGRAAFCRARPRLDLPEPAEEVEESMTSKDLRAPRPRPAWIAGALALAVALSPFPGTGHASLKTDRSTATLTDSSAEVLFREPIRYAVFVREPDRTRHLRAKGDSLLSREPQRFVKIERVEPKGIVYRTEAGGPLSRLRAGLEVPELPGFFLQDTVLLEHLSYRYRRVDRISNPDPVLVLLDGSAAVLEVETLPRPVPGPPGQAEAPAAPAPGARAALDEALLSRVRIQPLGPEEYELHRGEMRVILDNAGQVLGDLKPFVLPVLSLHTGLQFKIRSAASDGILGRRGFEITSAKLAGRAGLEAGDVILSVNGRAVDGFSSLFQIYQELKRDTATPRIDVELERDGRRLTKTYWLR